MCASCTGLETGRSPRALTRITQYTHTMLIDALRNSCDHFNFNFALQNFLKCTRLCVRHDFTDDWIYINKYNYKNTLQMKNFKVFSKNYVWNSIFYFFNMLIYFGSFWRVNWVAIANRWMTKRSEDITQPNLSQCWLQWLWSYQWLSSTHNSWC